MRAHTSDIMLTLTQDESIVAGCYRTNDGKAMLTITFGEGEYRETLTVCACPAEMLKLSAAIRNAVAVHLHKIPPIDATIEACNGGTKVIE